MAEVSQTEKAIALFERRVEGKPGDFLNRTILGELYLRQARESDDHACYHKAEVILREAVKAKPDHEPARLQLAVALQAHHRFGEALKLAESVLARDPSNLLALATLGDAQLEMGLYQQAEESYAKLAARESSPAVLARLARLDEINGKRDAAVDKITQALAEQKERDGTPASVAWFEWRLGGLAFARGDLKAAAGSFRAALALAPDYGPGKAGLAAVLAAEGDLSGALELLRPLAESTGRPAYLAQLGDTFAAAGDLESAAQWYRETEAAMAALTVNAEAHYREDALYFADHERNPGQAVMFARMDLSQRKDIYAWDTYAWALFRNGDIEDARKAMAKALARGTLDAKLFYHAGLIEHAAGDRLKAREYLAKALEINPYFSLLHARTAREALAGLDS